MPKKRDFHNRGRTTRKNFSSTTAKPEPINVTINYKIIGENLRNERKRLNYTQEQVAEAIDITPAFIGHIERAERSMSLETLIKLCAFYGVTIDYILMDTLPTDINKISDQIAVLLKDKTVEQQAAVLDIIKAVVRNI